LRLAVGTIEPVDPPEIGGVRRIRIDLRKVGQFLAFNLAGIGKFAPSRERAVNSAEAVNSGTSAIAINNLRFD
jgi:hypothetical protein